MTARAQSNPHPVSAAERKSYVFAALQWLGRQPTSAVPGRANAAATVSWFSTD